MVWVFMIFLRNKAAVVSLILRIFEKKFMSFRNENPFLTIPRISYGYKVVFDLPFAESGNYSAHGKRAVIGWCALNRMQYI